ncbi:hypothetical protein A2524_01635 [Candidatus Wolfebacteria bacterium RIFOXYD12_FULL_48_21]|uniref:AAA+ ATPase domain-containing protein n=1 Tax=Candidatus Wolfebacteria bacterium RIFOXYD1_FULL_48_65 TaxID=1802561 RepID=A0A1F8DZN1_9BACT|nr:MAG: hypothetical protein A2610_03610 [Candidatus Wolfebacteria bacterium RIFOXYD1_FULL_48_65]OGM94501.1 MAG: hypothetical protein A2524_01635 [Candidatus Wolfebacteria bacterium RIFOXYD12_FULL_48_21]
MTQDEAFAILKTGRNVFLTGEPGSGKSHMVNRYVEYLRSCGVEPSITASTGIAATHIGGMTIHSWSGIGVRTRLTDHDLELMLDKDRLVKRLRAARVLIIDEVSMLSGDTLAVVEQVCRVLRDSIEPFGGLQVVLVGDFFQLPPIMPKADQERVKTISLDGEDQWSPFAFMGTAWAKADPTICYLTEQHRQEDTEFLKALSAIRRGEVTDEVRECFAGRRVEPAVADDHTKLYTHNFAVDKLNDARLAKLPGERRDFAMKSEGAPTIVEGLKRGCLSPETLSLKLGAKVMFTKNSVEGKFVNGTIGEVVGFSPVTGYPQITMHNGKTIEPELGEWSIYDGMKMLGMIKQIPLRLAWAITVHKSQGMSLDTAIMDLSQAFEYGQGYVALSRVRTLAGLYLLGYNERALEVHPDVFAKDIQFRAASEKARYDFAALGEEQIADLQLQFINTIGGAVGMGMQAPAPKVSTYDATAELVAQKLSVADMAEKRGVTEATIITHLEKLVANGTLDPAADLEYLKPERRRFVTMQAALEKTYKKKGSMLLTPAQSLLGPGFTFEELRVARLFLGKTEDPSS